MASKALYFPYIRVPEDAWFTRALLYWDKVGTILPGGLEDDPRYVTPWMRALLEAQQLQQVYPDQYIFQLPAYNETFLGLLDNDMEVQARRRAPVSQVVFVSVHVGKLGDLAGALEELGLARRMRPPGRDVWIEVEERTADLYMAYLAGALGAMEEVGMEPLTNRNESLAALFGADTSRGLTLKRARELRIGVLEDLLPSPSTTIPVDELVKFKADHGGALSALRDRVDGALIEIATIEEDDARTERARILRDELVREREEIVGAMEARRWPGIAFGAVAGVVAAAAAVTAPFFVGGGLVVAAFAVPGVVPAAYGAVGAIRGRSDLEKKPVAYAAFAQRAFETRG